VRDVPVRIVERPPALLPLYARAALPRPSSDAVPQDLRLVGVQPDVAHVARYARVCGFTLDASLPLTYPHLLGFPLQLALMADRRFPFPATGLVHVANAVTQHEPLPVGAALDVTVHAEGPRPHPRGRVVDLLTSVSRSGADTASWTSTSTYLRRRPTSAALPTPQDAARGGESSRSGEEDVLPTVAVWRLPADVGRRYAAVSGDRNPIHLSALTAKAFGFPRAIAHGMWTAAATLAALQGRLPDAVHADVRFKAPVLLPSTVTLGTRVGGGAADAHLRSRSGRLHLVVEVRDLTPLRPPVRPRGA
jgi:acyl dehydratase